MGITSSNSSSEQVSAIVQNASQEQAFKVYTRLGIGNQVVQFLSSREKIAAQALNLFCYEIAIGRVETLFQLPKPYIFSYFDLKSYKTTIYSLNFVSRELESFDFEDVIMDQNSIQVGRCLFYKSDSWYKLELLYGGKPKYSRIIEPTSRTDKFSLTNFKDKFMFITGGYG